MGERHEKGGSTTTSHLPRLLCGDSNLFHTRGHLPHAAKKFCRAQLGNGM